MTAPPLFPSALTDKVNILIVDDRVEKLLALEAVLEDLQENIVTATSGREALRHVLRTDFAVILLDIAMPGMDGFETAALIRQYRRSRGTPIIFVTSAGEELYAQRSYELGAVDYILSPVIPDVLRTKVGVFVELFRKTLEIKRQSDAIARRAELLHKLTHASLVVSSAGSLDGVLKRVAGAARDTLRANIALTTFAEPGSADPARTFLSMSEKYAKYRGFRPPFGPGGLFALARGAGGCLRKTERELDERPEWLSAIADAGGPPLRGILSAPITGSGGRPAGIVLLSDKIDGDFNEDDEPILVQIAQLGSIAVQGFLQAGTTDADRFRDEVLAVLTDELCGPLQAVLDQARALREGPADPVEMLRGLGAIEGIAAGQLRRVEALLEGASLAASGRSTDDPHDPP
ncbi:MAG: response regulator [Byssovorax sp.]